LEPCNVWFDKTKLGKGEAEDDGLALFAFPVNEDVDEDFVFPVGGLENINAVFKASEYFEVRDHECKVEAFGLLHVFACFRKSLTLGRCSPDG
jgi:hypothetical protein